VTRLVFILGTRPETIKLAPVIAAARQQDRFDCCVIATGQHRELLDRALELFGIEPDQDLELMAPDQQLAELTSRLVAQLTPRLAQIAPDWVVVQGDTTTAFAGALAAAYTQIPLAHVEAGLRTGDPRQPFPEEINRRLISQLAACHFAPTAGARDNLLRHGIDPDTVHLTGNTVIDALQWVLQHHPPAAADPTAPLLLVTAHRRENRGARIEAVADAVGTLVAAYPALQVVFSLHPHPQARGPIERRLGQSSRVTLLDAPDYATFVGLMARCKLILTDSGGIQEEAPALGKPVLLLRNTTERPEGVELGAVEIVGLDPTRIVAATRRLLDDQAAYAKMAQVRSIYGDGQAAARICDLLGRESF